MVDDELKAEIKRLGKETGIKLSDCKCHCGVNKFTPERLRKILSERFNRNSRPISGSDYFRLNSMKKNN